MRNWILRVGDLILLIDSHGVACGVAFLCCGPDDTGAAMRFADIIADPGSFWSWGHKTIA